MYDSGGAAVSVCMIVSGGGAVSECMIVVELQ